MGHGSKKMPGARPARSLTPPLSLTIVLQCLVCMLQSVVLLLSCLRNHWAGCCVFAGAVIMVCYFCICSLFFYLA